MGATTRTMCLESVLINKETLMNPETDNLRETERKKLEVVASIWTGRLVGHRGGASLKGGKRELSIGHTKF